MESMAWDFQQIWVENVNTAYKNVWLYRHVSEELSADFFALYYYVLG